MALIGSINVPRRPILRSPTIARYHHCVQEPTEPAPPLTQQRRHRSRRLGAGLRVAEDAEAPIQAALTGVAVHAMDQLVVLDEADVIEPADIDDGAPPKPRKSPGDQLQAVDAHPRVPAEEIANVLVSLKPLQHPARQRRPTNRCDDPGNTGQFGFTGKGLAHSTNGLRFRDGVGVDGQHDVGASH